MCVRFERKVAESKHSNAPKLNGTTFNTQKKIEYVYVRDEWKKNIVARMQIILDVRIEYDFFFPLAWHETRHNRSERL